MLKIRLLGKFQVMYDGRVVDMLHDSPRLQTLLAYLVLHADAPQPRRQIAYLFWPESTEKQARTNLRKLLLQLRRVLPAAENFLVDTQQTIQWQPAAPFWVDVAEVRELLDRLQNAPENLALLTNLHDLYSGELLPNCYDEWVLALRRHLHEAVTHALGRLVAIFEERHAYAEGIRYAQRLLHLDPLGEENYLRLIRLRAFAGDRTGALQTYHDCVATLRTELDVEPMDAIQILAKQLQAGLPLQGTVTPSTEPIRLNASTAKAESPEANIRGLPTPTTPCIGRAKELTDLAAQLANPYCRLLTLYGPGGMGKTRLALALAEAQQHAYRHGVCFVSLAALSTPENIAPAIAGLLGLHLVEGRRPETQLLAHLREQQLLLILDNVEHLLTAEPSAEGGTRAGNRAQESPPRPGLETHLLIEQLLHAAPALKILITSREPLDLYEEHTYAVQGLSIDASTVEPPPADAPSGDEYRPQSAGSESLSAAETLFYHQLTRVRPDLTVAELSAADRAAVTAVCRLVEGMPLALELAATQLRTVTLTELVAGLQQNLDLLKVRWRGAHQRHQSMRAVIDASVQTLREADQIYLARLALFQGGFSAASAQAVAGASVDILDTLLHKSLLRRTDGDHANEQRFDLHTLIRQYAGEALAALPDEAQQTAARYCRHYADFLHDGMARWRTNGYPPSALAPLTHEIDNLSAVGRRLLHHDAIQQRQAYLHDLWDLYRVERRLPEIIELLHEAIAVTAQTDADAYAAPLAQWHRMLGEAYHILGEFDASRQHFEETLRVLNFPLAGGGIELLTTLQRQGLQQVLQRLGAMNLLRRAVDPEPAPSLLDAIEAYRQLVDISLFSGDLVRLANSALYALNLAERTNDPPARALTYSLMCLMASAVPGVKLGPVYERLALAQLPQVQTPERQIDIAIYLSAYYAGQGNWSSLDAILQPAIEKSRARHAHRRWGYCQAIWASTFIYRGQFVDGLQAWRTLYEQSLASDSFLFILPAWAAGGMALCNVRLGAWQRAIERAEAGLVHLQGKDDAIGRARCYVAIALAHLRREEYQPALTAADYAAALMRDTRPTNYAALECYAWVAEVYLALWQRSMPPSAATAQERLPPLHDESEQVLTSKQLKARAHSSCKALEKYAHVFPIGRASAALMQGNYAWLDGRPADAFAKWQQCIDGATALEMQYEAACAHSQLARHLPMEDPRRAHHCHRAEAIFAALNVVHDLPHPSN